MKNTTKPTDLEKEKYKDILFFVLYHTYIFSIYFIDYSSSMPTQCRLRTVKTFQLGGGQRHSQDHGRADQKDLTIGTYVHKKRSNFTKRQNYYKSIRASPSPSSSPSSSSSADTRSTPNSSIPSSGEAKQATRLPLAWELESPAVPGSEDGWRSA